MAVITISKEIGTQSEKVASLAAQKLGYEYIGKHLLSRIASELKISENEAKAFTQASSSKILRFVDQYTCSIVQKVVEGEYGCLDDTRYYDTTRKLVETMYEEGNVIILGWGSQCILKGKPDVLHVRLRKNEAAKVKTIMEQRGIDAQQAKKYIEKEEKDLKAYIKKYFDTDWNDAALYDLIIDMEQISVERAVDMICDNVAHKTP